MIEECKTGEDAERSRDCRLIGTVNSIQAYWADGDRRLSPRRDGVLLRLHRYGLRSRDLRRRPLLLPRRRQGVRRPRVLRGAADAVRRGGRSVRGGVRPRARVRAPRAGPARHARPGRRRPGGSAERRRTLELQADCFAGVWAANAVETGFLGVPRRRRDRRRRSTPRRPSATTASSERPRGRSTARRGRTAPRPSASSGS